jgi:hypothetical protein
MTTIEDYSVVIRGIPGDALDPRELSTFFTARVGGAVADVQVAYNPKPLTLHPTP